MLYGPHLCLFKNKNTNRFSSSSRSGLILSGVRSFHTDRQYRSSFTSFSKGGIEKTVSQAEKSLDKFSLRLTRYYAPIIVSILAILTTIFANKGLPKDEYKVIVTQGLAKEAFSGISSIFFKNTLAEFIFWISTLVTKNKQKTSAFLREIHTGDLKDRYKVLTTVVSGIVYYGIIKQYVNRLAYSLFKKYKIFDKINHLLKNHGIYILDHEEK